jgi:hypothetical protein
MISGFVSQEMYVLIVDNLNYEPRVIIRHIQRTYKYNISYMKSLRQGRRLFEMRFNTNEDSYDNLPHMLRKIVDKNPGSYCDVLYFPIPRVALTFFKGCFIFIGACVRAFQFYLPVVCIDGTFVTRKYKGQILTSIGMYGMSLLLLCRLF